jgi:tetratricopeptide (TPR) repeat protein
MKGLTKTATFGAAALATGVFACLFSHEHGLVLRQAAGASRPLMMTWFGLFLLSIIVLGVLCAYEIRKFFGSRAERWILEGRAHSGPVPELQEAERVRASGEPLDAIRLLREYLQANPYELRAMARIAEIYRYDLKNDLAAALEYEELLKHKLPDDQWAWSALHLAKLYGRLSEYEKSVALLERLDTDYGHTIAGRRAKKALQQVRNPESTETSYRPLRLDRRGEFI